MKKPEVGLRLVRELAERLRESERRYADIVGKEVPARLATQRVNRTRRRPGRLHATSGQLGAKSQWLRSLKKRGML